MNTAVRSTNSLVAMCFAGSASEAPIASELARGIRARGIEYSFIADSEFAAKRLRQWGTKCESAFQWVPRSTLAEIGDMAEQQVTAELVRHGVKKPREFCFAEFQYFGASETFSRLYRRALAANMAAAQFLQQVEPSLVVQRIGGGILRRALNLQCGIAGVPHYWLSGCPFADRSALDRTGSGHWVEMDGCFTSDVVSRGHTVEPPTPALSWSKDHLIRLAASAHFMVSRYRDPVRAVIEPAPTANITRAISRRLRSRSGVFPYCGTESLRELRDRGVGVVFYPMHENFDSQISVVGREYFDQIALIEYLQVGLPAECQLAIKEHPTALGLTPLRQLRYLARLGVMVVDPGVAAAEVLSHTDMCIVVNSTVGFDAIARGVPVLSLGKSFYQRAGLTFQASSSAEAGLAISNLLRGEVDRDLVEERRSQVAALVRHTIAGSYTASPFRLGESIGNIARSLPSEDGTGE